MWREINALQKMRNRKSRWAKYCSKCGKALNEKSTAKKNREKGIVLAVCVIVAVVLLVYTLGGRSYKKTIDTFVTSQFAVDAQSIVELLPEKVVR